MNMQYRYIKEIIPTMVISPALISSKRSKGGLISESFSLWLKSPKKGPNHSPEHYPPKKKDTQEIWHLLFGDLSQSEKFS